MARRAGRVGGPQEVIVIKDPPIEQTPQLLESPERVLSTLDKDGSRRWIDPRPYFGKWRRLRQFVGLLLLATFIAIPHLMLFGKPVLLLDMTARQFTILGATFLPTDTVLLALLLVSVGLTIAFATALFGRVFCGWACPHTLFMEFVIRPIERLLKAGPNSRATPERLALKYLLFLMGAWVLGNTVLAYFVGGSTIRAWLTQSPARHPGPFFLMAAMTAAFFFHVAYFREQLCLLACPYGRLQSVLLDRQSLIVAYDKKRGEPRGKRKRLAAALPILGDCVDCGACVRTCPTGIDIREGLQMECVNCTQCIDACDAIMTKLARPTGLIRYASGAEIDGEPKKIFRPRTVVYPTLLMIALSAFLTVLIFRPTFDATALRNVGAPFTLTEDGRVRNIVRVKLVNRLGEPTTFTLASASKGVTLATEPEKHYAEAGESIVVPVEALASKESFLAGGRELKIDVANGRQGRRTLTWRMIGPR
jgi:cytochrome c oxidase accessory protein FixG